MGYFNYANWISAGIDSRGINGSFKLWSRTLIHDLHTFVSRFLRVQRDEQKPACKSQVCLLAFSVSVFYTEISASWHWVGTERIHPSHNQSVIVNENWISIHLPVTAMNIISTTCISNSSKVEAMQYSTIEITWQDIEEIPIHICLSSFEPVLYCRQL